MLQFKLFEKIFDLLDSYKDRLGVLYQPLSKLLAAALFVAFVGVILWLPISYVGSFKLIAPIQIIILLVYFMVLSGERVIERFAFILTAMAVVVGGVPAILVEYNLADIQRMNPEAFPELVVPSFEVFFFGLLVGVGVVAWALPVFLFLFPAWSTQSAKDRKRLDLMIIWALAMGLVFHLISFGFLFWQGRFGMRSGTDISWLPHGIARSIREAQTVYQITFLAMFAIGLLVLFGLFLLRKRLSNLGFFVLPALGVVLSLACFAASRASLFQLNTFFPAANGRVEAFFDRAHDRMLYKFPLFEDLEAESFKDLVVLGVCKNPQAGEFNLEVENRSMFSEELNGEGRFVKHLIANLIEARDHRLICGQFAPAPGDTVEPPTS